jgi:ATP-dependent DNA ligase
VIKTILDELAATSSRLEKEAILAREKNNELLKKVVVAALDPMTNYFIRKIPEYTPNAGQGISLAFALDSIGDLSKRLVTGHAGIDHLRANLEALRADDAAVLERVIEKDLRCGVSEKTVNKIWPKLIIEYPVMLCSPYEDKTIAKIKFPAYVQLKLDGMRFNAICRGDKVEFRTRNGKHIDVRGHLEKEFVELAAGRDVVFDGELLVYDENFYQYLPRQTSNGILSKSLKGTITEGECARIGATLWDMIPLSNFINGKSTIAYSARFVGVRDSVELVNTPKIKTVWNEVVDNVETAKRIFEKFLSEGQEGTILKDINSGWEAKRVKHQIKFKGELECDLMVVGWEEGTGKNVSRLGALVAESSDRVVRVSIGSGFSDHDRNVIKPSCVGSVVSVKYNARIKDVKTGQESLFLPVFVELRSDKTEADSAKQIK